MTTPLLKVILSDSSPLIDTYDVLRCTTSIDYVLVSALEHILAVPHLYLIPFIFCVILVSFLYFAFCT